MKQYTFVENGKVIAEFDDIQSTIEYVMEKTQRVCDAHYILSRKKMDDRIFRFGYWGGFIVGSITGAVLMLMACSYLMK